MNTGRGLAGRLAASMLGTLALLWGTASPAQEVLGTKYSIKFVNKSGETGDVCVFQKDPDIGVDGVMSLAWFTKRLADDTTTTFAWEIDYSFVFGEAGDATPGVVFETTQALPADLSASNTMTFDLVDGAYTFVGPPARYAAAKGSIVITEGPDVQKGEAHVGIGMSGAGTFVVPAQPNLTLTFTPHPQYFIAFGDYKKGQILDIQSMTDAAKIDFRGTTTSVTATLNPNNTWTITQD